MSDIVERLGNLYDTEECPAVRELYADCKYEIERLRGDNAHWQAIASQGISDEHAVRSENERLRALVQSAYEEGLTEGQAQTGKLQTWEQSAARRALEEKR